MGLNARDIQLHLCRMLQVSAEISYTFIQRHPLVLGALLVIFILYIFLSYIYNFLLYLSPFIVCAAIFVRIFWSSEQTQLRHARREGKKGEEEIVVPKYPKISNNGRRELLYKYPSQNATSRRRNFRGKKWDVYGGLEEKAKDLSAVFRNEFTEKNTETREAKSFDKWEGYWDYGLSAEKNEDPKKQTLFSEPSMRDLVAYGAGCGGSEKEKENMENGEDEGEAQKDRKKAVELTQDDRKNIMDLGISEMERNKRLESLIARRRARKLLKLQIENGLVDIKSVTPSQIAPLFITRVNPFDSPKDFDGLETPGSAPPALRSPFDLPYDLSEEKPNLTGDSFQQEFTRSHQKEMPFCRHESFTLGPSFPLEPRQEHEARESYPFFSNGRNVSNWLAYPGVRRLPDKGNDDWLIEQLSSKEGGESGSKDPNPLSNGEETTNEEDGKCKTDMADIKDEEVGNAHATKSLSDHTSEPDLIPKISNVERARVSEKLGLPKPHERVLDFPISSTTATKINDSLYESLPSPVDKNQENMFFTNRRICHTPTYSLASDLQVEVFEVGSPTLTVDESHETNTTTDGESVVYDGDIDKDVTSGSEDMWGASLHSREVRGVKEEDIAEIGFAEVNNFRDIASPISLQHIDEENAADVSSMSSKSDIPEDTPTHAINSYHNIFGNVKDFVGETQPPHSSDVSSRWKRLMDSFVDHLPHKTHLEKGEEWCNLSENLISKEQVINDANNSVATEQDNTQNSKSNEDPSASVVRQETIDEASINSSSSSSPRFVLPQKTIADQVSSSVYNQQVHLSVQQSSTEDMAQATLNDEGPLDTIPQNIQHSMNDPTVESHNGDFSHSQDRTYPMENSIEESNMSSKTNAAEVCNKEDEEKLKNDENNEDKYTPQIRQDATAESPILAEMMTSEDMNEKSRDLVDDKVPLNCLMLESSSEVHRDNDEKSQASMRQEATTEPFINAEATGTSSAKDFEGQHDDLNKNEAIISCGSAGESDKLSETDKTNHSSEGVSYLQSESKEEVEDDMDKEKLDTGDISKDPPLPMVTEVTNSKSAKDTVGKSDKVDKNGATEQELNKNETMVLSESAGESDQVSNIAHMKEPEEVHQLEDVTAPKPDKPNDSSKEVGYFQRESTELVEDDMKKNKKSSGDDNEDLRNQRSLNQPFPPKKTNEGVSEDS